MALQVNNLAKRLQIRFNTGLDADFNPVYSLRSWSNVNTDATNQAIFDLGVYIGDLCEHTVNSVRVNTTDELEEL